jgi:hypothetical protein
MDEFNDTVPTTAVIWRCMIWEKTRYDRVELAVTSLKVRPWNVALGTEEDFENRQCCWDLADIRTVYRFSCCAW